jgi:hypothetical protein
MTPEERFDQIEAILKRTAEQQAQFQKQQVQLQEQQVRQQEQLASEHEQAVKRGQEIDKQNDAIRSLIVVARTCLDSFQEIRDVQRRDREDWVTQMNELRAAQAETGEKLNILVNTVDRIIRRENHP